MNILTKIKKLQIGTKKRNKILFTTKKAIVIILIISITLQSNAQFLGSIVFAEEASDSASINIEGLRVGDSQDSVIDIDVSQNSSAEIKQKSIVKTLKKKNYLASEKISVEITNGTSEIFTLNIQDPSGHEAEVEVAQEMVNDEKVLEILPPQEFRPGKYTVEIKDSVGNVTSTQDFLWGVLAINTNKSMYLPEETADLTFAVLDEMGYMVCDADLTLIINTPDGSEDTLTTKKNDIRVNDQCHKKEFSLVPDFESYYKLGGSGKYEMRLFAETKKGSYSITDSIEVRDFIPYEVERKTVTRIFPPEVYPMEFEIKANSDFSGTITDVVPASFEIIGEELDVVEKDFDKIKTLSIAAVQGRDVLGINTEMNLPLAELMPVSSVFGDVIKDPLLKAKYEQFGLEGHDGIDFEVPVGTEVISVDDGSVVLAEKDGDYGMTLVIEHKWGKSYYGHLSEFEVKLGDEVKKGDLVALSGNTGLSTGPHLHFGVKSKDNDSENGYYGKIDPSPYLNLPDESSVLGASTVASLKVKVISWNVDIKKGEKITLNYSYKTPPKSPQFYTLGTAKFYDEDDTNVFEESRAWQLAIDASNYAGPQIKTVEYSFGNTNTSAVATTVPVYATDSGTGSTNGWTTTTPTLASDGFNFKLIGTNIKVKQAWVEFRAQTTAAASMADFSIGLSTCPGSVATCSNAPVYEELPLFGTPANINYFVNSAEHNIFVVKANAVAVFDGLSDSDWATGVETLLRSVATGPSLNLHTAKLTLTYESDFDAASHDEIKTVRFPLDSTVAGDTGSKRTAIAAGGNSDFGYTADIPDLASNSDIQDVFFEISQQESAAATDGTVVYKINSGTPTNSPTYPTVTNLGDTLDGFKVFRPTVGTNNFLPNTAQTFNIAAATNPIQAAGGELVITYKYSTGAATQTETVKYLVNQTATSGSTSKNSTTISPVISNTGLSVKNIYVRAQTTLGAARNLTVYGDIDGGGAVSEKNNAYTLVFTGGEEIGQQRIIYDMSADAASFASGGNLSVATQWSGTLGGPVATELFITYTWSGSSGGVITKSVEYYMDNSKLGGTAGTTAQNQRNVNMNFLFPESVTKTLRSAYVENAITSSDTTSPVNVNMGVNEDAITSGGTGFVSYANTGEGMAFYTFEDMTSSISVANEEANYIFNYISDATSGFSPKGIVTYDVDYSETEASVNDRQIRTVEYSFGNSNTSTITSTTPVYATGSGTGSTDGWTTTAPTLASDGFTYKLLGSNIRIKDAWVELRAQTTAAASMSDLDIALSTCPGTVATCSNAPVYRTLPLFGTPTNISYFINSAEHNIFYVKANALGALEGISDSDWSTGVETLLKTSATGPNLNLHTAKLVITYESDYDDAVAHDEVRTVRFPLDSDNGGDTGSKQGPITTGGNQDFSYNADIPELVSNSDVLDVFFEVTAQVSSAGNGTLTTQVVSGSPTSSPSFPTLSTLGDNFDQLVYFRPTVGTDNFVPNSAQKLNIAAATNQLNAPGGELVVTYKFSSDAATQTETVRYYGGQGDSTTTSKVEYTIAPTISNTDYSVVNIYARAQAGLGTAARNLTVYGDIDDSGAVSEISQTYSFTITGPEEIGQKRVILDMSGDAASFSSGGNMTLATQWSGAGAGPASVELFVTFHWDASLLGPQTRTIEYYMDNSKLGGTAATTAQTQRNVAISMSFPESVSRTLRSAFVESSITSSDTALVYNQSINADAITTSSGGQITTSSSGEARSFVTIYDISSSVSLSNNSQNLIYNYISDGTSGFAPKTIVTYDADFDGVPPPPTSPALFPVDGTNQISFNNIRDNSNFPLVRASATHTGTFNRFQLEFNSASDFTGTAYTETFSGTYSSATEYNLQTTGTLALPTTDGVTYYVRVRASANAGVLWSSWSSGTWSYTYSSTGDPNWFQTTDEQFSTGTLDDTEISGSDSVGLATGGVGGSITRVGAAQASPGTANNVGLTMPAGVQDGDVAIVSISRESSSAITLPSGEGYVAFDTQDVESGGGSTFTMSYFYTVLQSADASQTHTFSFSSIWRQANVIVLRGVDTSTPPAIIDPAAATEAASGTTLNSPSESDPSVNGMWVLWVVGSWDYSTKTMPGTVDGYTVTREYGSANENLGLFYAEYTTSSAISGATVTFSNSSETKMVKTLTLKPANAAITTGTIMSPEVDYDWGADAYFWNEFDWSEDETNGTVKVQLYYTDSTACDTIVPDGDLSGNSTGFTSGPVDISGLNTTTYNRICMLATLNDSGGTSYLEDWNISWLYTVPPTSPVLYPEGGATQIAFADSRQNSSVPVFRGSATHASGFNRFQIELNTAADFLGTAYTQTFTGSYSTATEYNLTADTLSPSLPTTNGVTYYARLRASADGGSVWSAWTTDTWAYTYSTSGNANWFQTTDEQFSTGSLSNTEVSGSDSVQLSSSGGAGVFVLEQDLSDGYSAPTSKTLTLSSAPVEDNIIIIYARIQDQSGPSTTFTWPSGFTEMWNVYVGDAATTNAAAYKVAGSSETTSYAFSWDDDSYSQGFYIMEISGVDPASPIDVSPVTEYEGFTTSYTTNGITTVTDGALHVMGYQASDTTTTPPSGYTEYEDSTTGDLWISADTIDTAGSTGTFSISKNNQYALSFEFALKPAPAATGTIMSPEIDYDWFYGGTSWNEFTWSEDETNGTVRLRLYYTVSTACDTIVPNGALSGNSTGFTSGPVDISGLNTTTYNKICLQATLNDSGGTPYLQDWTVSWNTGGAESPTLAQLMRHGRWFNSVGVIQPFTF